MFDQVCYVRVGFEKQCNTRLWDRLTVLYPAAPRLKAGEFSVDDSDPSYGAVYVAVPYFDERTEFAAVYDHGHEWIDMAEAVYLAQSSSHVQFQGCVDYRGVQFESQDAFPSGRPCD